uniref:Protein FAR1-RELATED SEQUENCE n=1 Tax=Hordeum vulgare subsp. vulgare TaxID=112509 RepID=A0A8I6XCC8_HORVV
MYRKRRLWVASYLSDGFFIGMRSNQRNESMNSSLHLHLGYGTTIVDLVVHYENCIVHLRENEAHDDCEANQNVPPVIIIYKAIEEHAAKVFTHANFYILQDDLKKMGQLKIFETLVGIERQTFTITWQDIRNFRYNVVYEPGNSEETISYTCLEMVRKGLPCKHILFVLHHRKLSEIPKCCVLNRLSKNAIDGLPVQRKSDLFGWGWSGPEKRERYSQVSIKTAEAAHVALDDPFLFDELMKCLDDIIAKKKIPKEELIGRRRCALIAKQAIQAEEGAAGIRDPHKVSTKGAPKKGRSKGGPDVTKNDRPKDFREKKSGSLCGLCHLPGHNKATCSLNEKNWA